MTNGKMKLNSKYFRVVQRRQYYRLVHIPSGDYVQRYLHDFLTRKDAIECRNCILAAAPAWDWSDPEFMTNMPSPIDGLVWDAIYANPRRKMMNGSGKANHAGAHNWTPNCVSAPCCHPHVA